MGGAARCDADRRLIRETVAADAVRRFVITHGTDTMIRTAQALRGLPARVIVLTGAMQPAKFHLTDAVYNIASAVTAVQILPPGVYIAMNGRIFDPDKVRKNVSANCFEAIGGEA